jgi:ABC-type Fe3+-hydroxamate transport system substrate-binding protein
MLKTRETECSTIVPVTPPTTEAAIAVLFERLDHAIKAIEALSEKMDAHNEARKEVLADLEQRVAHIEQSMSKARAFMIGLALGVGALGGGTAGFVMSMLGG